MQEFGVSRTVVREALSKLQAAGMVRSQRGVGSFVAGPSRSKPFQIDNGADEDLDQALALFELRIGLESEAAALAAQRRTDDELQALRVALRAFKVAMDLGVDTAGPDFHFHLEMARASHSPHFASVLEALGPICVPTTLAEAVVDDDQNALLKGRVLREHLDVLESIERQDVEAARAAMRIHLTNGRERRKATSPSQAENRNDPRL